jgi:hypothetical protein
MMVIDRLSDTSQEADSFIILEFSGFTSRPSPKGWRRAEESHSSKSFGPFHRLEEFTQKVFNRKRFEVASEYPPC